MKQNLLDFAPLEEQFVLLQSEISLYIYKVVISVCMSVCLQGRTIGFLSGGAKYFKLCPPPL